MSECVCVCVCACVSVYVCVCVSEGVNSVREGRGGGDVRAFDSKVR